MGEKKLGTGNCQHHGQHLLDSKEIYSAFLTLNKEMVSYSEVLNRIFPNVVVNKPWK
jgi:hypothetical protein